jgi:hypothetical protein
VDYQRIYNVIIEHRKHQEPEGYSERHHIVPRSFGGPDTPENVVRLTAREHFLCHYLLTKIHPTGSLHYKAIHAFGMMVWMHGDTQERYRCTSRLYDRLKKEHALAMSKSQKGEKNSQYGKIWITNGVESKRITKNELIPEGWAKGRKIPSMQGTESPLKGKSGTPHTEETKKKLRAYRHTEKAKRTISKASRERFRKPSDNPFFGKTHTEDTKRKISEANKKTKWITNGTESKKIKKGIDIVPEGWYNGRTF